MADKGLNDLFKDTLRDVYYAEKQVLKSLPKMERAANAEEVKQAFRTHLKQTEGQIERLEKVFGMIDLTPRGKKCEAIDGILKEGDSVAEDYADTAALDAGLIAAAQAVEHYERSPATAPCAAGRRCWAWTRPRACSSRPSPRSPRPTTCSPRSRTPAPTRRRWRRPRVTADR